MKDKLIKYASKGKSISKAEKHQLSHQKTDNYNSYMRIFVNLESRYFN
jgi:hypothetical protein